MTHIPSAGFCAVCGFEMKCAEMAITLEARTDGGPYYKIQSDLYRCSNPSCDTAIFLLAQGPLVYQHELKYSNYPTHRTVYFHSPENLKRFGTGTEE